MTFKLTDTELQNAFDAISHHGYSAMLPPPPEWEAIEEKWGAVKDYLAGLDLDTYSPYKPLRIFAPKSRSNIRVVHLLHPEDLLIYTALVLIVKDDLESARISKRSQRVYSYRSDKSMPARLYDSRGSHEKYLSKLEEKAKRSKTKFVGVADIADFYPRIYQHRLENVVESTASSQRGVEVARVLVRKLISNLMEKNSYGIPVGPYASRILGEAVLIDVDAHLHSKGVDFVRWVDDYNIFTSSEYLAQSTLYDLAEWLYANHGLTLQPIKTKILRVNQYRDKMLLLPEENLTDRDHVIGLLRETVGVVGYDDELEEEDLEPDEEEIESLLTELQGYDLRGLFLDSVSDEALVDYEMIRYVLTRLPLVHGEDDELREDILELTIENAGLLYPAAEFIAGYVLSFEDLTRAEKRQIAAKLLKPLKRKNNPPPDHYAMWILHIFSTSADWNHIKDIVEIYQTSNSNVVKRFAALAIAAGGTRADAIVVKDDLAEGGSSLLRLAVLIASRNLGVDERKHWKLANTIRGVVEKVV